MAHTTITRNYRPIDRVAYPNPYIWSVLFMCAVVKYGPKAYTVPLGIICLIYRTTYKWLLMSVWLVAQRRGMGTRRYRKSDSRNITLSVVRRKQMSSSWKLEEHKVHVTRCTLIRRLKGKANSVRRQKKRFFFFTTVWKACFRIRIK